MLLTSLCCNADTLRVTGADFDVPFAGSVSSKTGGVSFAQSAPAALDGADPSHELDVIKAILLREGYLKRLNALARKQAVCAYVSDSIHLCVYRYLYCCFEVVDVLNSFFAVGGRKRAFGPRRSAGPHPRRKCGGSRSCREVEAGLGELRFHDKYCSLSAGVVCCECCCYCVGLAYFHSYAISGGGPALPVERRQLLVEDGS